MEPHARLLRQVRLPGRVSAAIRFGTSATWLTYSAVRPEPFTATSGCLPGDTVGDSGFIQGMVPGLRPRCSGQPSAWEAVEPPDDEGSLDAHLLPQAQGRPGQSVGDLRPAVVPIGLCRARADRSHYLEGAWFPCGGERADRPPLRRALSRPEALSASGRGHRDSRERTRSGSASWTTEAPRSANASNAPWSSSLPSVP